MSAVAATRRYTVPRGANALERGMIRLADAATRWATQRADRRQERHAALLESIRAAQTRRSDPHAAEHLLAQMGLARK